jgi:hypothetical protein
MLDNVRTIAARVIVHRVRRSHLLVIRAWFWLAAEAQDTEDKRRCLNAILDLDPDDEPASLALLLLDQRRPES